MEKGLCHSSAHIRFLGLGRDPTEQHIKSIYLLIEQTIHQVLQREALNTQLASATFRKVS